MATAQNLATEQTDIQTASTRLVWVLNRDVNEYKGTFRGTKITIPANMERIPLRAEKGGNLMPYLEARRFISDLKEAQGFQEDENGDRTPIFGVKSLIDHEMTAEEVKTILGKSSMDLRKEALSDERSAKKNLQKELDKRPNKLLMEDDPN